MAITSPINREDGARGRYTQVEYFTTAAQHEAAPLVFVDEPLLGEHAHQGAADEPARLFVFEADAVDVAAAALEIDVAGAFAGVDARAHFDVLMSAVTEENVEV